MRVWWGLMESLPLILSDLEGSLPKANLRYLWTYIEIIIISTLIHFHLAHTDLPSEQRKN